MMEGAPGRERKERTTWTWYNIAAAVIVAFVAALCALGAYASWWLFMRGDG